LLKFLIGMKIGVMWIYRLWLWQSTNRGYSSWFFRFGGQQHL